MIDEHELMRRISELPDLRTISTGTIGKIIKECKAINAEPVAAQSKWISVEDKLPDIAVSVIICRKHGKDAVKVEQGCMDGNGWWISYGAGWTKKVTHWMQLPEPPDRNA